MSKVFGVVLASLLPLFFSAAEVYSYTITATAGPGGSISPSGAVTVTAGTDQSFNIMPDEDHGIFDVVVDSSSVGPVSTYNFQNVSADHSISASFTCNNSPVMLEGNGSTFGSIMVAYNYASVNLGLTDFTLRLLAGTLPDEDLDFNRDVSVVLDGGYDCSFLDNTLFTIIPGSMTISGGTAITSNIVLSAGSPCEPGDPNNFPGNPEICDGLDNNCNGLIDDGLTFDADNDGYSSIDSCGGTADDCNDNNPSIHPYGEIYGDGIDQDCDGQDLLFPVDGDCFGCHSVNFVNTLRHRFTDVPDPTCTVCHSAFEPVTKNIFGQNVQVIPILPAHYGQTVRTVGNNMAAGETIGCTSCHDWHDEEFSGYAINGDYIVWAKVHAAGDYNSLTCDTCHENRAAAHATETAHDNRIIDNSCGQCHTSDTSVLGSPGSGTLSTDADVDTLHRSDCTLCHAYSGTKIWVAVVEQAIEDGMNGTQITCLDCHGGSFSAIHAYIQNHNNLIQVGTTSCGNCHYDPPPLVDPTDPKVHNACTSCHDAYYNTISLAEGKSFAVGGDCTTCHGDHFPNHIHHSSAANNVSYDANVDTSQTAKQGCAGCHLDYDMINGTSLGLSTWQTILVEHDLDGNKDGSTNTCDNCHFYDGSSSAPLTDVQNAIASSGTVTCADCHTDKVPDVEHGIPTSGQHPEHRAPCSTCHNTVYYPTFKSGTDTNGDGLYDLTETDVCFICHQDSSGNPTPDDFKLYWYDPLYELTCGSCHNSPPDTGTHLSHYSGNNASLVYGDLRITEDFTGGLVSSVNMIGCGNCHPIDFPFHGNAVWGEVELANSAAPVGSLKALSAGASYDETTGTCSNIYCHSVNTWATIGSVPIPWPESTGWEHPADPLPRPLPDNIVTTRVYRDVTWNSGETLTCDGCHENPPKTSYLNNDGGSGDSHYWIDSGGYENMHVWNMGYFPPIGCRTCHFDTVQEWDETFGIGWDLEPVSPYRRYYNDVPIYDKAKHVNGSVDIVFDTLNNFTFSSEWSGNVTPIDLSTASFDQVTKTCSNVGCHLLDSEVIWGLPYRYYNNTECDRCHNYNNTLPVCSDCHTP